MNENKENIESEIDQLIDNFELKPITKGLGFHHSLKEKKEVKVDLKSQSKILKSELETRISQLKKENINNGPINMGELAPFYNDVQESKSEEFKLEEIREEVSLDASMSLRFGAWLLDLTILVSSLALTFVAIAFISDIPLEFLSHIMVFDEIGSSLVVIGLLYYSFYFTVLDRTHFSTVGKNILGLKLISESGQLSLFKTFFRVLFSIVSIPLIGLPILLGLQDKLFEVKVIQK